MKRGDLILVGALLTLSITIMVVFAVLNANTSNLIAVVTDANGETETIELYGLEEGITYEKTYVGTLGDVVVEYENGRIRVAKETSPQNICSKQGWTSSVYKPLVCLPNDFYITLDSKEDTGIDGEVG